MTRCMSCTPGSAAVADLMRSACGSICTDVDVRPVIQHGVATRTKKSEDVWMALPQCRRSLVDDASTFASYAVFDGHNGVQAATYAKDMLLDSISNAIPGGRTRSEWQAALPKAMVIGFMKTDADIGRKDTCSGTTATIVFVDDWTVTVAAVGDSRCVLDTEAGGAVPLTVDHRLDENTDEVARIVTSGGHVARMRVPGGYEIGPLRSWPGGLCISRSLGDNDAGKCILPVPHVKQIKLSNKGGRLILATDGVWDILSNEKAAKCCRGLPPQKAASFIMKEALKSRSVRDDMTCIVIDIVPPEVATCELTCNPRSGGGGRARGGGGCHPGVAFEKAHLCGSWEFFRSAFRSRSGHLDRARPSSGDSKNDESGCDAGGTKRSREKRLSGEKSSTEKKPTEKKTGVRRVAGMEELYDDDSILMSKRLGVDVSIHTGVVLRCEKCKGPVAPPLAAPVPGRQVVSADADFWKGPFQCRKCKGSRHGGSVG